MYFLIKWDIKDLNFTNRFSLSNLSLFANFKKIFMVQNLFRLIDFVTKIKVFLYVSSLSDSVSTTGSIRQLGHVIKKIAT